MERTLSAFLDYQRRRNIRQGTVVNRIRIVERLTEWVGGDVFRATPADIEAWLDSCDLSPGSRNTYVGHVKAFWRWAIDVGLTDSDPTTKLTRSRTPRRLPRPADDAAFALAVATATPRMKAWLLLAGLAGLRCHEIVRLRRKDIDERADPPTLFVADGKGGHQREVPIHPDLLAALRPFLGASGWLFETRDGHRYHPGTASSYIAQHFRRHDLPVTAHQLRHWFGTHIYQSTGDLRLTQHLLGHSDPKVTAVYTLVSPVASADAVMRLTWRHK